MGTNQQKGFTLIELMVVMAILVLLSLISYRSLINALDTRHVISEYSEQLREFELGLFLLSKDLRQIHVSPLPANKQPFRSELGEGEHHSGELFRLLRSPDAEMLRGVTEVSYFLKDKQLWQQTKEKGEHFETSIFSNVNAISVVFYGNGKKFYHWQESMPPDLVQITLQHQRYGKILIKELTHTNP